mgnify:CR=1 FL=1
MDLSNLGLKRAIIIILWPECNIKYELQATNFAKAVHRSPTTSKRAISNGTRKKKKSNAIGSFHIIHSEEKMRKKINSDTQNRNQNTYSPLALALSIISTFRKNDHLCHCDCSL